MDWKAIENKIGYTLAQPVRCENCKHHLEKDGFVDRTWDSFCTLHQGTLGLRSVQPTATCNFAAPKGK